MYKKIFVAIVTIISLLALSSDSPAKASGTSVWKTEKNQVIKKGKWTTLTFGNRTAMPSMGSTRTLYCSQVHFDFGKKKPSYVKLRLGRVLPNGKLNTTGTNTWAVGKNAPRLWQGSMCWPINTKYPMVLQVKFGGGDRTETITQRQFKAWNPGVDIPDTVLVFE
jgi:hypothetical protein